MTKMSPEAIASGAGSTRCSRHRSRVGDMVDLHPPSPLKKWLSFRRALKEGIGGHAWVGVGNLGFAQAMEHVFVGDDGGALPRDGALAGDIAAGESFGRRPERRGFPPPCSGRPSC